MGLYRDSQLGLCLDIDGADGNVFCVISVGDDIAKQLDMLDDWRGTIEAIECMEAGYQTVINAFQNFFPMVTIVGYEEVFGSETDREDLEEDY